MMWAIFSKSQPQNLAINNSFKRSFLSQEVARLENLQNLAKVYHLTVSNLLRSSTLLANLRHQNSNQKQILNIQNSLSVEVEQVKKRLDEISNLLNQNHQEYMVSVQTRDLQKQNDHIFFKNVMISYDNKRKELKDYIYQLQNNVQNKQVQTVQLTHRTFRQIIKNENKLQLSADINEKFKTKIDSKCKILNKIKYFLEYRAKIVNQSSEKIIQPEWIFEPIKEDQLEELQRLLIIIYLKDKVINQRIKEILNKQRQLSHGISQYNNQIKVGLVKYQNATKIKQQDILIRENHEKVKRSTCISYLKQENQKINLMFEQGIEFKKRKRRSHSCITQIKIVEYEKVLKVSTVQNLIKKPADLYGDITVSFNQHLQYIISQKFIQEDDLKIF